MERILLIEPNYKNKYPPIGLMKIATYYKNKGDFVEFHKGLLPSESVKSFNKVLITTLFTFDFNVCIQTINYYIAIIGIENVYVGGIAATIMPEKFLEEIPNLKINTGQLTSSNSLGYADNVNIDILELDYDILWDVTYNYPASDSYFVYTTRGCPRKCDFCAVRILEPVFYDCDNIREQIARVDEKYGPKRNLLIMDNNILNSTRFKETVEEIVNLGFGVGNNKIKKTNKMKYMIRGLEERIKIGKKTTNILFHIREEFSKIKVSRIKDKYKNLLKKIFKNINDDTSLIKLIIMNKNEIEDFFSLYNSHYISRYVDFNQGLDARFFTETIAEQLSRLSIRPCRIAFDDIKTQNKYIQAMTLATESGIRHFSNYLLYNYKDEPKDLWKRLEINIKFREKYAEKNISLFSFPMKYASIKHTDRNYVGINWNKKYLRAINVILNVTSGIVPKESDFFYKAFGKNENEFIEILSMPDDFIRYRSFFEDNRFTYLWKDYFHDLSTSEKQELLHFVSTNNSKELANCSGCSEKVKKIIVFYTITKKKVEANYIFYENLYNELCEKLSSKDKD